MIAGIHESEANQNAMPQKNHQRADILRGERRERRSIGAMAKHTFSDSPRSANALHISSALAAAAAARHQVPFEIFIMGCFRVFR